MTNKPISKERRAEIEKGFGLMLELAARLKGDEQRERMATITAVNELLSDAAFWRDAVKNADVLHDYCPFCDEQDCKPDCPWLLAQE